MINPPSLDNAKFKLSAPVWCVLNNKIVTKFIYQISSSSMSEGIWYSLTDIAGYCTWPGYGAIAESDIFETKEDLIKHLSNS